MDSSKKYDIPSPEETANPLSKIFFIWVLPFFKIGYKNNLQIKDLYNCSKSDLSGPLGDELERNWKKEVQDAKKHSRKPSLLRTIRTTFIKSYAIFGVLLLLQSTILKMCQPIILAAFLKYFDPTSKNRSPETGWGLGVGVVLLSFLNVVVMHQGLLNCSRIGMRCRIACCSLIYRKLLKLNRTSLGQIAVGKLVNLLSNDVQRFDIASPYLHFIWIMPIQACIAFYLIYRNVGLAAFSGLGAITLQAVPLQGLLSKLLGIYRFQIAQKTDNRVKLMNEITSGMQVIKMYAWEKPFEKVVELARKHEIDIVAKTAYIRGLSTAMMVFTERVTLYLTLITYVLMGNRLTADIVFSMAQLFNTIQLYMSIFYSIGVSYYAEAVSSVNRIEEFLIMEESSSQDSEEINEKDPAGYVQLTNASANWTPNSLVDTLTDINVVIKPGTMCCVVGSVGAGKSSLLQVLLQELPLSSGHIRMSGSISYACQEPWLFVSSVRNNILFGLPYLKDRYKNVAKVCALERDFEQFPYGDKTLVGEKGSSLSGGQRARINLARTVYRDADIYLFDDPLSAVDTHVGKHMFEECFLKYLHGKTRILVTHQLQFLKQADLIIVLNNGKVEKIGTFNDLSENELNTLNQDHHSSEVQDKKHQENKRTLRIMSISSVTSSIPDDDYEIAAQETQEEMGKGAIPFASYAEYYRAGGSILLLLFFLFLLVISQAACNSADVWLTHWTNMEDVRYNKIISLEKNKHFYETIINDNNSVSNSEILLNTSAIKTTVIESERSFMSRDNIIGVYTALIICAIILVISRHLLFFKICLSASRRLHNTMFSNILQATMRFFDTNPSGRILSRFSKDMGAIDETLPLASMEALQIFLVLCGIMVMVFIVTPWMIAPTVVLALLFYWFRVIYLASAQDVKRLEGITRAPVFSHVSASLYGLSTIRAANAQNMVIQEFDSLQNQHTSSWYLFLATGETFGFYLDIISLIFLAIVTFQFLAFDDGTTLSGNVGLVVSQSLILTGMLQYGVRQTAEIASNMTSVERVLQYTKLDKEGPFQSPHGKKPESSWPQQGHIVFKNVFLRYAPEAPPVLKNFSIEIKPGEKVGIVGRTGAGKSTLIASLFRLANIEGSILIDDVNTKDIGLSDLRSNISIIPQEPILFSNTVRYNLDPFEKCDDSSLWQALEKVELKDAIESLDQAVSEGGSNFSAGQRQLVCLARAIVRNKKVLVMDEATANVDPTTDSLIQSAIRKNFKNCTVLTIAHRLNTIMDSDKVLVMDTGCAMEFAHPHELLEKTDGFFTKMVKDTGTAMEGKLRKIAQEHYERNMMKD